MTNLGSYRLLDEIGSGGMGTVYRAIGADGATVALKVIHPHLIGKEGFRERFAREVEVGRRIRDDNVVATLAAGETEADGKPTFYLAMEFVEGQTLRELLEELGRVPEDLCLHIGRRIARALVAIHAAGVFHRDIKPENVMITPDSRVKVMDLGVALLADESIRLSQSGVFVGSVLYAAPEQFGGLPADGRADLYNLGLLLYELATGQHPFMGDDLGTVIQKQMTARPRPPAELNPQLSPFFEEVVLNLVAKDREQRLPSAAELLYVLDHEEESDWWRRRAREMHTKAAGPLRRIRIPRETPLEGRDAELAELGRLFECVREGEGRVLLIEGEAGIGKTRLVEEFTERLSRSGESFHYLLGSYPPGGAATAAGAFSTAYREFFGSEGLDERLKECFAQAPGMIPAFAAMLVGSPPPPGVAPLSRDALLHAFALATQALAAEQPTVIVIEDLHFAPELGRAIFASLAASIANRRVLLIGTARPGLPATWLAGLEHTTRMEPGRLTPKELSRLLVELFRSEKLAGELGWAIATKSDGNPFFVFELVRALREEQLITREPDGTWIQTGLIKDLLAPSSVLDLVDARIRDLDELDKDLLEVASCCGFEFDPLLVAAALEVEQIPAMKRFAHLEKKHRLVRAAGRRYVFDHHQVQEALYRGLPELLREPYHARLGAALEERHAEVDGAGAVDLCEHFLAGAAGERAKPYLPAALAHLRNGYLHDEAIELARRALAVDGLYAGAERVGLLVQTAASLEMRGRHAEDRVLLDEALLLADALDDPALKSTVRVHLGRLAVWSGEFEAAHDWLIEARDWAQAAGDERLERMAVGNLGVVYYRLRRYDDAFAIVEQIRRETSERGDRRALAVAILNLGNVHWIRGETEEAQAHYADYRALSREIGYREGEALAAGNLGHIFFAQGCLAQARAQYTEVIDLADRIGDRHKTALFEGTLGEVELTLGRPERARTHFERSLALARAIGMPREEAAALVGLAAVAKEKGDWDRAQEQCEQALAVGGGTVDAEVVAGTHVLLARIARAADREADAVRHLDTAIELGRASNAEPDELALALALRACLPGGDAAAAERKVESWSGRCSVPLKMQTAWVLYEATGKPEWLARAREHLEQLRAHAPEEDRDSVVEGTREHRAIWDAR